MTDASDDSTLRAEILAATARYIAQRQAKKPPVHLGKRIVRYAGRNFDEKEVVELVAASLDFWLTSGPYTDRFEQKMRAFFDARDFVFVNSGSSANLAMISALCCRQARELLRDEDLAPLQAGDEIITPAVTFPTTP